MSQAPKVGGRSVSGKVEKATELEVAESSPAIPKPPPVPSSSPSIPTAPGSARTLRPPPPSRPSQPSARHSWGRIVSSAPEAMSGAEEPPTDAAASDENTIHLGDGDLEPLSSLSALGAKQAFSIRRGVVLGGRFRVKELIGAGAQCFVYSAEHTTLKSPVAIKCLQPDLVTPDLVERFAREAQALTAIRNAHVAAVLDVGRAPCGTPFIVMEFLEGRDLAALLDTRPRLEPRQATEILLQTCEGLAAAHALGLVHQDIKPSNIFLSDEMGIVKAKVVDFGVARVAPELREATRPRFSQSKLDVTVGGTPFYMPPEQFYVDSTIDPRSDIFSLGMVLYEMLRGTHAFDLEMSTRKPGDPVRIQHTGIDPALVAVIERCLEQKPEARFESVAELAVALLPFAPSRSRSHAEAAAALLRKAGLSVKSTMPSSIPPPMSSQSMLPVSMRQQAETVTNVGLPPPKRAKWPFVAAIALVAVGAAGGAFFVLTRAPKSTAQAAPPAPTTIAPNGSASPAIAINPMLRSAPPQASEPSADSAGALTAPVPFGARPVGSGAVVAKGGASAAPLPKAGAKGADDAPRGSASAAKAPAAPAPSAGTSEDLGF